MAETAVSEEVVAAQKALEDTAALIEAKRRAIVDGSLKPFAAPVAARVVRVFTAESAEKARVDFLPVRDYFDEDRWNAAVRAGITRLAGTYQHSQPAALMRRHRSNSTK